MTTKDVRARILRLIEEIPDSDLPIAEWLLESLCRGHDPTLRALLGARSAEVDEIFVRQVNEFMAEYRQALETLARA